LPGILNRACGAAVDRNVAMKLAESMAKSQRRAVINQITAQKIRPVVGEPAGSFIRLSNETLRSRRLRHGQKKRGRE
jgi:hypothetical protein